MHPALRKGPLFYNPPSHFISCLRACLTPDRVRSLLRHSTVIFSAQQPYSLIKTSYRRPNLQRLLFTHVNVTTVNVTLAKTDIVPNVNTADISNA